MSPDRFARLLLVVEDRAVQKARVAELEAFLRDMGLEGEVPPQYAAAAGGGDGGEGCGTAAAAGGGGLGGGALGGSDGGGGGGGGAPLGEFFGPLGAAYAHDAEARFRDLREELARERAAHAAALEAAQLLRGHDYMTLRRRRCATPRSPRRAGSSRASGPRTPPPWRSSARSSRASGPPSPPPTGPPRKRARSWAVSRAPTRRARREAVAAAFERAGVAGAEAAEAALQGPETTPCSEDYLVNVKVVNNEGIQKSKQRGVLIRLCFTRTGLRSGKVATHAYVWRRAATNSLCVLLVHAVARTLSKSFIGQGAVADPKRRAAAPRTKHARDRKPPLRTSRPPCKM